MVADGTEAARKELGEEYRWLVGERGRAKVAFKDGSDPSHIWFLDELIVSIQARIEALK